jgi:hypothetical protein
MSGRPIWHKLRKSQGLNAWAKEEYPHIQKLDQKMNSQLFFGDESKAQPGRNIFSAVDAQGRFRFMWGQGDVNVTRFIEFITHFMYGNSRNIFLIVSGNPLHTALQARNLVQTIKDRFGLFFLPGDP